MSSSKSPAPHRSKNSISQLRKRRIARACLEGLEGRVLFSNIGVGPLAIPQLVADLNGDGHADIISVPGDGSLAADVSFGNGDGTFQPPLALPLPYGTNHVLIGDVNGDGKPDLIFAAPTGAATSFTQAVTVFINNGDSTFQPGVSTDFGVGNGYVFSGDFNGDGKADLLIESGITGTASVALGHGDGTFGAPVNLPTGPLGATIGAADFNGDGVMDVAFGGGAIDNPDGSISFPVSLYLGNGNGTFGPPTTSNKFTPTVSTPAVAAALAALFPGDLNGDGLPDLLTTVNNDTTLTIGPTRQDPGLHIVTETHTPTTMTVQLLNAAGVPQPGITYDIGNSGGVAQILDLNGDGHVDMVIQNTVGDRVFINKGDDTFRDSGFHGSNGQIAVGDFNGDGIQDLVTTGGDIFLGNSDGSFNAPVSANVLGEGAYATAVGDLNGDGNLDTVVTNTGDNNVSVAFGNGRGQFWTGGKLSAGTAGLSGQGPRGVAIGDFTGDGIPDIAIAEEGAPGDIGILAGNGDGTFQPVTFHGTAGGTAFEMVSADFNGDGIADLLVTNPFTRTAEVIAGGSLNVVNTFSTGQLAKLAVGDFNGDGRPDFVIDSTIYLNGGSFAFTPQAINTGLTGDSSIVVADFNGDGHADLVYSDQQPSLDVTSPLMVLLGNGDGTFQAPYAAAPGQQKTLSQSFVPSVSTPGTSVTTSDFNGDGIPDLAVNGIMDIGVSLGRGDGGFYPQTFFNSSAGGLSAALAAADVNHDGRSDILQIDTGTSDTRYIAGGSLDTFLNAGGARQAQFGAVGFKVSAPTIVTENAPFNVTVTAVDAQGNPVPGFLGTVYLSLDQQISIPYTFTAANAGTLTISNTELALTQGAHTVTAAVPFMSAGLASVDAEPGHFTLSIPAASVAGTGIPMTITALDALGNPMPSFTGSFTISTSDPRVAPISPFINASNGGVFNLPATQFGTAVYPLKTAGNQTISVTAPCMGVTTQPIMITPGAPMSYVISNPGTVTAGVPFKFTATAFDQFGNFAPAYTPTVSFSDTLLNTGVFTPDPGATLPAAYTYTTADAGGHQFTATLSVAGFTRLLVNSGQGLLDVAVAAAPNTQLRLITPASITAGQNFGFTFQALDQFGNLAGGLADTMHFSSSDPQAILPANLSGQNNLTLLATLKTAGNQSITVTDLSNPAIAPKTMTIAVMAATASSLQVAMPPSTTAGAAQPVTVTARDSFGNIATDYTGTIHFSSSDPRNTLPADYTFTAADAGTHTFSVTMAAAGSQWLSAQDTVNTQGGVAFITVAPSTAVRFAVSGFPASVAGVAQSFTVAALDAYGNLATGYTGTVAFSSSDVQGGLPASYTFTAGDGGFHTFAATLKTAGLQSISVADSSSSTIRGTQSGIAVTHAAATHFGIVAPSTAATGKSFLITVSALDAFGNVDTGYLGKIHLGATVSTSLNSNYSFTTGDAGIHTFSVTLNTAGVQTISVSDTLNSSIFGSVTLTVSTPLSGGGGGGGGGTSGGGTSGGGTSGGTGGGGTA